MTEEATNKDGPPKEPITQPDNKQDISTPEIKEMEVHKHPHHITHKKKWGEYLLEFFMLFLAVFLGFVAENIREISVEHEHEKQFAKELYSEFYADSIVFTEKLTA